MGPYRSDMLVPAPKLPATRRPGGPAWVGVGVGALVTVGVVVGGPLTPVAVLATAVFSVRLALEHRRRRRAIGALAALPFPVRHDSERAIDPVMEARAVRSLRVELKDGTIVDVDDWSWGREDIVRLAQVLETLHAERGVVVADVQWARGGPVLGI